MSTLLLLCLSSRDDSDNLFTIFLLERMRRKKDDRSSYQAERLPPLFSTLNSVYLTQAERIIKKDLYLILPTAPPYPRLRTHSAFVKIHSGFGPRVVWTLPAFLRRCLRWLSIIFSQPFPERPSTITRRPASLAGQLAEGG